MSEEQYVLSLKDIDREREVAYKASLHNYIDYVRFARQIESAVIDKLRRGGGHIDLLVDIVRNSARDLDTAMGLVDKDEVAKRQAAAFVACADWWCMLSAAPSAEAVRAEAERRYAPKKAAPPQPICVALSTGVWWKMDGRWCTRQLYQKEITRDLLSPICDTAEDYEHVAAYLRDLK